MSDEEVERLAKGTLIQRALIRRAAAAGLAATAAATYAHVLGAEGSAFTFRNGGTNGKGIQGGKGVQVAAAGGD